MYHWPRKVWKRQLKLARESAIYLSTWSIHLHSFVHRWLLCLLWLSIVVKRWFETYKCFGLQNYYLFNLKDFTPGYPAYPTVLLVELENHFCYIWIYLHFYLGGWKLMRDYIVNRNLSAIILYLQFFKCVVIHLIINCKSDTIASTLFIIVYITMIVFAVVPNHISHLQLYFPSSTFIFLSYITSLLTIHACM